MKVGDGFYEFGRDIFGRGFELQRRWVTRVDARSFRHSGGATESHCDGTKLPRGCSTDPKKAFEAGKDDVLVGLAGEKVGLLKKLQDLEVEERKVQSLKFEHVRVRGDNETYEQFKRSWDSDY